MMVHVKACEAITIGLWRVTKLLPPVIQLNFASTVKKPKKSSSNLTKLSCVWLSWLLIGCLDPLPILASPCWASFGVWWQQKKLALPGKLARPSKETRSSLVLPPFLLSADDLAAAKLKAQQARHGRPRRGSKLGTEHSLRMASKTCVTKPPADRRARVDLERGLKRRGRGLDRRNVLTVGVKRRGRGRRRDEDGKMGNQTTR